MISSLMATCLQPSAVNFLTSRCLCLVLILFLNPSETEKSDKFVVKWRLNINMEVRGGNRLLNITVKLMKSLRS